MTATNKYPVAISADAINATFLFIKNIVVNMKPIDTIPDISCNVAFITPIVAEQLFVHTAITFDVSVFNTFS